MVLKMDPIHIGKQIFHSYEDGELTVEWKQLMLLFYIKPLNESSRTLNAA